MSQDTRKNIVLNVPRWATPRRRRSPILWSHGIASDILRVEQHNQPANNSSECCLPNYLLSIHLGQPILLERTVDGQRSHDYLIEGDIMLRFIFPHLTINKKSLIS